MGKICEACKEAPGRHGEEGFALVAVIWIATLLAVAAAVLTASVRGTVREAAAERATAEAEAAADAGIHLALLGLLNSPAAIGGLALPSEMAGFACTVPALGVISVRVRDEAGRVDLNIASGALLTALFTGLGLPADEARALSAKLADWRDADEDRREGGAERREYEDAGRRGPRNAPLDAVEELTQVLGFDDALVARLSPYVTVHSGQDGVDPASAIPGLAEILDRGWREAGEASEFAGLESARGLPPPFVSVSTKRRVRIEAEGTTARGARFVREAVVSFAAGPARPRIKSRNADLPYHVHLWRRGTSFAAPSGPAEVPPCQS